MCQKERILSAIKDTGSAVGIAKEEKWKIQESKEQEHGLRSKIHNYMDALLRKTISKFIRTGTPSR